MADLVKMDPFRSFLSFPRWFDELDEGLQRGLKVRETDKNLIAEAVVAGVTPKNVDVNIEDGVLTIKAQRTEDEKDSKSYYSYYYTCALSGGQWDKAEAEIEDGVVTVTIPKTQASRPKKITVKPKSKKK